MTAAVTPGREELPEISRDEYERLIDVIDYTLAVHGKIDADTPLHERIRKAYRVPGIPRLAAKPDEDGVRDVRQTVLKVYGFSDEAIAGDWIKRSHAYSIATQIAAALSTTGKPKP